MYLCNLDKLGLKIFSLIFKKVHSSGSPERMCRLGGQPWFPEEVKVNRDKVQNLSARQPPVSFSTLGAVSWISLSRELWWNLSFRFPLCQISMWFSSSQSCRSMGFFSDSFFFSHIVKWKEARLMSGKFKGTVGHRNWGTLALFFMHIVQEPQFLLGKTTSGVLPSTHTVSHLLRLLSRGAGCGRQSLAPGGEHKLLWLHLSKGTIFYHWFHLNFSQYSHSEVADPCLPAPRQRVRMLQGHCVSL